MLVITFYYIRSVCFLANQNVLPLRALVDFIHTIIDVSDYAYEEAKFVAQLSTYIPDCQEIRIELCEKNIRYCAGIVDMFAL